MDVGRFESLAEDLARQQGELPRWLEAARAGAEELHRQARQCVDAFVRRANALGAANLGSVSVSPLMPDEKHVDCLQFSVERGRTALLCIAIANAEGGKVRLVGPFKRGRTEGPCGDYPLRGPEVEAGLEGRMLDLLRQASGA